MDSEQLLATGSAFCNRFWIFSNHFTFFAPTHFFCNKSKTMLQQLLKQLFLVWLLNNSLTRGEGFPGAIRFVHNPLPPSFQLFGYFFWDWFSGASFLTENALLEPKGASKLLRNRPGKRPRNSFLHFPANLDFERPWNDFDVFLGFHSPWNTPKGINKVNVKQHEKKHHGNSHFGGKCSKTDLKMTPKMWVDSGENRNGLPRVALFHFKWKKCSPCPPKVIPKNENGVKRGPEFSHKWWPRPGGLREALTI